MAGKPTTLGGCELDQTAECPRSRRGGHGRDLGRLDVNYRGWASGGWFAKSTQGLLGIQDAVVGRWRVVVVCGGCALVGIIVRAWWPWPVVGVVREGVRDVPG